MEVDKNENEREDNIWGRQSCEKKHFPTETEQMKISKTNKNFKTV